MIHPKLLKSIERHEGWRDKAYQDSEGIWTIGYGRNLQELRIDQETGRDWLTDDIEEAQLAAERFPEYALLDTIPRKHVFVEMVFNMGPSRVAGFKNMLSAIREGDFEAAATEMLDSKWARQVGKRANRMSVTMLEGSYQE